MDIGRYWYECRDGQVVPKGCVTEDGRRVDLDETYNTDTYRMKCVREGGDYMTVIYVGCVHRGSGRDIGAQWDDGIAYFTCVQEGSNVRVVTLGCVDQGRNVKLEERVAKGDFIYQCRKAPDGTPAMNKVGCVFDGRKYNIGETFEGTKVWYSCTGESGAKIVGCMYESRRLVDGDMIFKDDASYVCRLRGENTDFDNVACVEHDANGNTNERRPGCVWQEGGGYEIYEYTCKEESPKKLVKVQTKCIYRESRGSFIVEPGCIRLASSGAIGCTQDSGKLRLQMYSADQIDSVAGLRRCG